jgi:hypothetical protein
VARSGSKTWRKDYRWDGKRQTFTIGPYPQVRLADARRKAIDISEWVREGIDPRAAGTSGGSPVPSAALPLHRASIDQPPSGR